MKSTLVTGDGSVVCPVCGAHNSFTVRRTMKAKVIGIPTIGVGTLLVPRRLRCNGCGTNLKASNSPGPKKAPAGHGKACVCKSCCDRRLAAKGR